MTLADSWFDSWVRATAAADADPTFRLPSQRSAELGPLATKLCVLSAPSPSCSLLVCPCIFDTPAQLPPSTALTPAINAWTRPAGETAEDARVGVEQSCCSFSAHWRSPVPVLFEVPLGSISLGSSKHTALDLMMHQEPTATSSPARRIMLWAIFLLLRLHAQSHRQVTGSRMWRSWSDTSLSSGEHTTTPRRSVSNPRRCSRDWHLTGEGHGTRELPCRLSFCVLDRVFIRPGRQLAPGQRS